MAFDLLCGAGVDIRTVPWSNRRTALEEMGADWQPPLGAGKGAFADLLRAHHASFMAFDLLSGARVDIGHCRGRTGAPHWKRSAPTGSRPATFAVHHGQSRSPRLVDDYRPAGIEGLVIKGAATPYTPGKRGWVKVKNRETREGIIGAVIGPIKRPDVIVAGLRDAAGHLLIVGRSVMLTPTQSQTLGQQLQPPTSPHPWPVTIGSGHFGGGRDQVDLSHVEPIVVAEITADTALQGGKFRHPLRYLRRGPTCPRPTSPC